MRLTTKKLSIFVAGLLLLSLGYLSYRFLGSSAISPKTAAGCKGCNILLIDIDILRADELPCYGYVRNTTPNICALAKESALFENNYSNAEWTLPSAFSTFSSLLPTFHRVQTRYVDTFPSDKPLLTEELQKAGYETILVIDWDNPAYLTVKNGGARGFNKITTGPIKQVIEDLRESSKPWFVVYYTDYLHMPYLIEKGEQPIENLSKPENFPTTNEEYTVVLNKFLKLHATDIFQKKVLNANQELFNSSANQDNTKIVDLFNSFDTTNADVLEYLKKFSQPSVEAYVQFINPSKASERAYLRMMYDTKIQQFDQELGGLFDAMRTSDQMNNTIITIMSDHGENFGEYGKFNHSFDGHSFLTHTPLIFHLPQMKPVRISQVSSNLDIFPTIMDLVMLPSPNSLQGLSLEKVILNNAKLDRDFIYSDTAYAISIQNEQWYYLLSNEAQSPMQSVLYNKILDPEEKTNVAQNNIALTESLYKRAKTLLLYQKMTEKNSENKVEFTDLKIDPVKIEQMKKEGYF